MVLLVCARHSKIGVAVIKIFFLQADRQAEFFRQVGMILFLVHLIEKIFEQVGIVAVLDHAESEAFEQRDVVQIMLQRPALQSFRRQLAGAQLGKVGQLHQLVDARLNDLFHH